MGRFMTTFLLFSYLWITFSAALTLLPTTQPSASSTNMIYSINFKIVNKKFDEDHHNSSSPAFMQLAQEIEHQMNTTCKQIYPSTFVTYKVKSFENGSVVTKSESTFKTGNTPTPEQISTYVFNLPKGSNETNFLNTNLRIAVDSVQIRSKY
uniref:SEA domain-containing protein n=1 Tax=Eptatretus burgeri TaxID=7764 RepID=A0A8C4QMP3_EPTBU